MNEISPTRTSPTSSAGPTDAEEAPGSPTPPAPPAPPSYEEAIEVLEWIASLGCRFDREECVKADCAACMARRVLEGEPDRWFLREARRPVVPATETTPTKCDDPPDTAPAGTEGADEPSKSDQSASESD